MFNLRFFIVAVTLVRGLWSCRYNRAEMIQNLAWTVGLRLFELPEEIQEKLSHLEKDYFKRHSAALESYMSKVDLNLNVVTPFFLAHMN